jgi:hypothetical protein
VQALVPDAQMRGSSMGLFGKAGVVRWSFQRAVRTSTPKASLFAIGGQDRQPQP